MSFPESSSPMLPGNPSSGSGGDADSVRQSVASLRLLLQLTVAALVVVVASVNVFFFHQVRLLRRQAADVQAGALEMAKAVGEYETNTLPLMERFSTDLKRFAERDPAFATLLSKYPLPAPKATNAPASSMTPVAPLGPASATKTVPSKAPAPGR